MERFRKRYGLGTTGVIDAKTEIALAQRALEEIAQQSMFPTTKNNSRLREIFRGSAKPNALGDELERILRASGFAMWGDAKAKRVGRLSRTTKTQDQLKKQTRTV